MEILIPLIGMAIWWMVFAFTMWAGSGFEGSYWTVLKITLGYREAWWDL